MLRFDKCLKRVTGIETPLYKLWWRCHCEHIQSKLAGKSLRA